MSKELIIRIKDSRLRLRSLYYQLLRNNIGYAKTLKDELDELKDIIKEMEGEKP